MTLEEQQSAAVEVDPQIVYLRARLEALERRIRVIMAGCVLSFAVFMLLGVNVQEAVSQSEVLRARRIEVIDGAGRVRTVLAVLPDGSSGLALLDAAERVRMESRLRPDGAPELRMWDAAGRRRIALSVSPEGSASLYLWDSPGAGGQARLGFNVLPQGPAALSFWDDSWQLRIRLAVLPGEPLISIWDAKGQVVLRAP